MLRFQALLFASALSLALGCGSSKSETDTPGAGASLPTPCENETEREPGSGIMQCDNGLVHRAEAGTCAAHVPSSAAVKPSMSPDKDECLADSDCTAQAYGYCVAGLRMYGGPEVWNTCRYGCTVDAECDTGTICVCGGSGGDCHPASCTTDGACGAGAYCAEYSQTCTTSSGFSCQMSSDECELSSDCGTAFACGTRTDGTRFCTFPYCGG